MPPPRRSLDADASSSRTDPDASEVFSSAKGVDKGFKIYNGGHVQKIEAVAHTHQSFVRCNMLPTMKKDTVYKTKECLCTCTAGLGGVCNNVASLPCVLE